MKTKHIEIILIMVVALLMLLVTTSKAEFTANVSLNGKTEVKVGEEVQVTIELSEKVVACNYEIGYDKGLFEFVGSGTTGLTAAVNGDKVSCVYVDMSQVGTKTLTVKFKALKETEAGTKFNITGAKYRAEGQEESYTGKAEEVKVEKINNVTEEKKPDQTTGTNDKVQTIAPSTSPSKELPNTGVDKKIVYAMVIGIALIVVTIITRKKAIEVNKILKRSGLMLIVPILIIGSIGTTKTYAAGKGEIKYYNSLVSGRKNATIELKADRSITKSEAKGIDSKITDIEKADGTAIGNTDNIKTGDKIKVGTDEYIVILYGDANGDGIICDTDDIMEIVNDYLGKKKITDEKKIAANLENKDNVLDTDDIMQMVNYYLGKSTTTVKSAPSGNITPSVPVTTYTVTLPNTTGANYTISGAGTIQAGQTYTATVTPDTGYSITSITITMGGNTLVAGTGYTEANGVISIPNVTGNITITASVTQNGITTSNILANPSAYIGQYVNYGALDSTNTAINAVRWKIFNVTDNNQIQLIADECIVGSNAPTATNILWENLIVTSTDNRDTLLKYLNGTATYINNKDWTSLYGVTINGNQTTVKGGPSLEEFKASYNLTHSDSIDIQSNVNGYQVKSVDKNWGNRATLNTTSADMYGITEVSPVFNGWGTLSGYWTTAASAEMQYNGYSGVICILNGEIIDTYHDEHWIGCRPIITLPVNANLSWNNTAYNIL